ncbi:methyltransferase domain-containing protein [archaeon]|nr:methyltransferase domain-containing protein [archaeon]
MIKENLSNSCCDRWIRLHSPEKRQLSAKDLNKIIQKSPTPKTQAIYWKDMEIYGSSYESIREPLSNAYEEILSHIFSEYIKKSDTALEIGCGPHASFYNFLPEKYKNGWLMFDINDVSVHQSKNEHDEGKFLVADYHQIPFKDESFDIVAGFNAFETTRHLNAAVSEAYKILKPQGCLLSIQDVIPSDFALIAEEDGTDEKDTTIETIFMKGNIPILIDAGCGNIDIRSYHIGKLQRIAENSGLEIIFNGIIESDGIYPRTEKHDIETLRKSSDPEKINSFIDLVARPENTYDSSIPDGYVRECVAVNVLIAKRPATT